MANSETYLVTGAGSGIGAAVARRLASSQAHLILHTRANSANLEAVAADCRARGAQTQTVLGDLGEDATLQRIGERVAAAAVLNGFVFAAGYSVQGGLDAVSSESLGRAFKAMPESFLLLARHILPQLRVCQGHVVAVSSFNASAPRAGGRLFTPTAVAKGALEVAAHALAAELAPDGIPVNTVAPGYIRKDTPSNSSAMSASDWGQITAAIAMGRLGEPGEVADAIEFFLSAKARYVTGQVLRVDGGLTL